jgi:hypothetical protein
LLLGVAPAGASAAGSWLSGPLVESQDFNCIIADVEQEAGSYLSYYVNPSAPTQAGQVYYVAIDVTGIGNTCAGIYADVNLIMPNGTTPAVSASHPVYCYLGFPGASSYTRDTQDCPQNLSAGLYGYSLDPVNANPPFWPLPQGGTVEIQVPVVSSGAGDLGFEGYVQLADGDLDPTLAPTMQVIVDQASQQQQTAPTISITYQTPSSLTSNTFESGGSYPGTTTVTMVGYVWNQNETGNAAIDLAYADSAGNCNDPKSFILTAYNIGTLASPDSIANITIQDLFPDVAYCWRLDSTITSGAPGTYHGNWQYFVTQGTYHPNWTTTEPPAATPQGVSQCGSNGSGCQTSGCTGLSCGSGGSLGGLSHTLSVAFGGTGSGSVAGPAGFSCAKTCNRTFATGATVKLTATPGPNSKFVGWSGGGCSGTSTCTVKMSSDQSVTANFASTTIVKPACSLSVVSSKILLKKKAGVATPVDTLVLSGRCTQAASGRLTGMLTEHLAKKRTKQLRLGPITLAFAAGQARTIDVKLPSAATKALKKGTKESVALTLTVSNANGAASASLSTGNLRHSG